MPTPESPTLASDLPAATPHGPTGVRGSSADPLQLEPALCCLCGIEDVDPIGVGEDFEYRTCRDTFLAVRCRRCGMVYLNPRPAPSEHPRIYPDHYHAFDFRPEGWGIVYRVRRWLEARRALRWCHGLPPTARILDVGCGDGFHLKLLRDFGHPDWSLEGVELDPRAVAAAERSELKIHCGKVEDLDLPRDTYNLILLIMTIEHVSDPVRLVGALARLLAPGGRLIIVTDNASSPDFHVFRGRHWGGYHFPRHFHLFTRATLSRLAELVGLRVEHIVTPLSPVNWVYSVRNWIDDWGGPRWLVRCFSLSSVPALAWFTLWDFPL
ncbi:MAG TPA: class I SAM-dependent methyltransferase, partial [Pirellulaceae bacterium]